MNTICLIGRPNTGKSTLFNRLIKEKKSIILDEEGITRDRVYGKSTFNGKTFYLIDTGGIDISKKSFVDQIRIQAEIAIADADVIIFVLDGLTDLNENDKTIAKILKKTNKKVLLAINKLDNDYRIENIYNFYELGFENIFPISATHNRGIVELLNEATKDFNDNPTLPNDDAIRFSFIGRPNVGKSSLVNALLNEERVIVSPVAGTTRDAIDTKFTFNKEEFVVVDTAGLRKKGKIFESVEKYSLIRTLKAIDTSDVCVLVIDAEEKIIEQDKHIISYALEANKPLVIAVNKWDKIENKEEQIKEFKKLIENELKFIKYVKVVFLSAETKKRVNDLIPLIKEAYENSSRQLKTSLINDVIRDSYLLHQPPSYKGKKLKIYFVSQTGINPPEFTFNVNNKSLLHFSYKRYLENSLRNNFNLEGTPIILKFKNKNED